MARGLLVAIVFASPFRTYVNEKINPFCYQKIPSNQQLTHQLVKKPCTANMATITDDTLKSLELETKSQARSARNSSFSAKTNSTIHPYLNTVLNFTMNPPQLARIIRDSGTFVLRYIETKCCSSRSFFQRLSFETNVEKRVDLTFFICNLLSEQTELCSRKLQVAIEEQDRFLHMEQFTKKQLRTKSRILSFLSRWP